MPLKIRDVDEALWTDYLFGCDGKPLREPREWSVMDMPEVKPQNAYEIVPQMGLRDGPCPLPKMEMINVKAFANPANDGSAFIEWYVGHVRRATTLVVTGIDQEGDKMAMYTLLDTVQNHTPWGHPMNPNVSEELLEVPNRPASITLASDTSTDDRMFQLILGAVPFAGCGFLMNMSVEKLMVSQGKRPLHEIRKHLAGLK